MRILILCHGHPATSIGGAEVAAHNLFRALNAAGDTEAFFLARAAAGARRHAATPLLALRQSEREVFLHADRWDEFWLSNDGIADLSGAFAEYLAHVEPDIVHFHHLIGLGLEALVQVRRQLPHTPIVVTFHEYLPICANHGQMVKTGRHTLCHAAAPAACAGCFPERSPAELFQREQHVRRHLLLADAFVSPSRFLVDRYVAWGLPEARFHVIENGLDAVEPAPPRPLARDGRRNRFGFFGQISEFKGLAVLLDAIARVPEAIWGNASLSVFGGNLEFQPEAFRTRFAALMERAGTRARFYGSYRPADLPRLMQQIDWTVVPSIWWENSPVVIQESFLHRRPLIVSDIGGMAEKVRHGIDGLHFRVGSPEDLADRLGEVLTDETLWDRLSASASPPPDLPGFARAHLEIYHAARRAAPAPRAVTAAAAPQRRRRVPEPQTHPTPVGAARSPRTKAGRAS